MNLIEFQTWIQSASTEDIAEQMSRACMMYAVNSDLIERRSSDIDSKFFVPIIQRYLNELKGAKAS